MRLCWTVQLMLVTGVMTLALAGSRAGADEKKKPPAKKPYKVYFIGHSLYDCGNVPAAVQFLSEAADVDRPIKAIRIPSGRRNAPELLGNSARSSSVYGKNHGTS